MYKPNRHRCRGCKKPRAIVNARARTCADCEPLRLERANKAKDLKAKLADAYEELIAVNPNKCAICGMPPLRRRLNVDHDHATGQVRGLLCYRCNYGLDWFRDDPVRLRAAAEYLEKATTLVH